MQGLRGMLANMKTTSAETASRNPITLAVGRRLKEIRIEKGLSQEDLAHEACVGRAAISAIESGTSNPTVLTLASLCAVLGVSLSHLFAPLTMALETSDGRRSNAARPPKIARSRLR